jgi:hypothetical protein
MQLHKLDAAAGQMQLHKLDAAAGQASHKAVDSGVFNHLKCQCQNSGSMPMPIIMPPASSCNLQVIIGLLRSAMMSRVPGGSKSFLIDGFPRALDQAQMFEKMVKQPQMVLAFDCPEVCQQTQC